MKVKSESEVAQSWTTLATPWTAAHQAPPSMGFSRQEYWSGVPLPSPLINTSMCEFCGICSVIWKKKKKKNSPISYEEVLSYQCSWGQVYWFNLGFLVLFPASKCTNVCWRHQEDHVTVWKGKESLFYTTGGEGNLWSHIFYLLSNRHYVVLWRQRTDTGWY